MAKLLPSFSMASRGLNIGKGLKRYRVNEEREKRLTRLWKTHMVLGGAFHNLAGILNLENEDNYPNIRKLFEIARTRTISAEANLNYFRYQEVEN